MSSSNSGKKLMTGTGIYAVGTFGTKILMFLLAPLYTYYLIPSEMGTYDVLLTTIGLLIPIISLQISDAVYRWIIRENVDCAIYLRVTYQFLILSSLLAASVILLINHFIIRIPYLLYFMGALFFVDVFSDWSKNFKRFKETVAVCYFWNYLHMYISFFECFSTMCITSRNRKFTYELYCSQFGRFFYNNSS